MRAMSGCLVEDNLIDPFTIIVGIESMALIVGLLAEKKVFCYTADGQNLAFYLKNIIHMSKLLNLGFKT